MHYQLFNTTVKICRFCSISHGEICSQNQWKPCLNYCGIWNTDKISRIYQQNICSVQLQKMNVIPLVNKPYVNEVNWNEQNLYLKSCQTFELKLCILERLRSFQRGTVGLFRSTGSKVTSCQSWRVDKKFCPRPESKHTSAVQVRFPDERIILQLGQLVTLEPVDLQRPTLPLWKDLNLLNIHSFNSED